MSDIPYPDTPQPDIPVPPQPDWPAPLPESEPDPEEEPDLLPLSRPSHLGTMFRRWVSSLVSRGISKPADERTSSKALGSWIR